MTEAWIAIYYDGNYTKTKILEFETAPEGWPASAKCRQVDTDCEVITAIVQVNGPAVPLVFVDNGAGYLELDLLPPGQGIAP